MSNSKLIRFDWAIKKLLRDKANFDILEGFLTVVLQEQIIVQEILESESNQEAYSDKFNKVDILVKNSKDEFVIIEIQNSKEYDYFQRMLYGTSKVITEHIKTGDAYSNVKKVYSITVAYFDLGQGDDYVYHGTTEFIGIHSKNVLELADKQKALFEKKKVNEIFPEYWIIKADKFNDAHVSDKLDEWIYFLKNSEIPEGFTAPGLKEAKEKLTHLQMNEQERKEYAFYEKRLMDIASQRFTEKVDLEEEKHKSHQEGIEKGIQKGMEEGMEKGIEKGIEKVVTTGIEGGFDNSTISKMTGLPESKIQEIRDRLKN